MPNGPDPAIFREYDIRGTYGVSLNEADAGWIGLAVAALFRAQGGRRMAVGRDGRLSSPALEAALIEGLLRGGVDVLGIGVGPTPMLYYAEASAEEVQGGIQITGSHNPADDNGFKIVFHGGALFGARVRAIGELARDYASGGRAVPIIARGRFEERAILQPYVERLLKGVLEGVFEGLGDGGELGAGLRIGWDAGNGAVGEALERLTPRLAGEHILLFTEIDGHFPNHHPDPTQDINLADLRRLVAARHLDFGVAFDGDGDRIVVVDGLGRTLLGDQLLAILARDMLIDHPGALILADVKASQIVFDEIAALGGRAGMAAAGHSLIKSTMKQTGALLAGETTGHIFYADRYYGFDDALYAALRLMAAVRRLGRSVAELRDALPQRLNTPELRFAVDPVRKLAVVSEVAGRLADEGALVDVTDGLRVVREGGWWLLRASNTQDMLTGRAEAASEAGLAAMLAEMDTQLALSGVRRG